MLLGWLSRCDSSLLTGIVIAVGAMLGVIQACRFAAPVLSTVLARGAGLGS